MDVGAGLHVGTAGSGDTDCGIAPAEDLTVLHLEVPIRGVDTDIRRTGCAGALLWPFKAETGNLHILAADCKQSGPARCLVDPAAIRSALATVAGKGDPAAYRGGSSAHVDVGISFGPDDSRTAPGVRSRVWLSCRR